MRGVRAWEWFKTFLIVALAASAVFLASKTGLFDEFFASVPLALKQSGVEETGIDAELTSTGEAARPLAIVLTGDSGLRHCVKYSDSAMDELYGRIENLLGEALGSSSEAKSATDGELQAALGGVGALFDFQAPVPLSALAGWLGAEMLRINDAAARRIALIGDGQGVTLWYTDDEGGIWRCGTAAGFAPLAARIAEYQPNGAAFAYESGAYKGLDPYCTLLPDEVSLWSASYTVPSTAAMEAPLLEAFSFGPYAGNSYPEADGTVVYVGDGAILRLYEDGDAVYKSTEHKGGGVHTPGEQIELARRIAQAAADLAGDARVYLTSLEQSEDGTCRVEFGYVLDGVRVSTGYAAEVDMDGGEVTQARLRLRSFTLSEEKVTLLPEPQAAAVAQRELPGGALLPAYTEAGGRLLPVWTAR